MKVSWFWPIEAYGAAHDLQLLPNERRTTAALGSWVEWYIVILQTF